MIKKLVLCIAVTSTVFFFLQINVSAISLFGIEKSIEHVINYDGCGSQNVPIQNARLEEYAVELINEKRLAIGLPPLKMVSVLRNAARYHAADMIKDNYRETATYDVIDGNLIEQCNANNRLRSFYPQLGSWTMGVSYTADTAGQAVSGWLSGGQLTNWLLSEEWDEIGIGYYANNTQTHQYWVLHQGTSSDTPLIINNEQMFSYSTDVDLYIYGNFNSMRLRKNGGQWGELIPFQNKIQSTVDDFIGEQTIEVELHTENSIIYSQDTIYTLIASSATQPQPSPTPDFVPSSTPSPMQQSLTCNPSNGSGGLTAGHYDVTLLGQKAIIVVGENYNPTKPAMLAFYLHGDGGNYAHYSFPNQPINNFINDNGWIYVSVQSTQSTDGITRWWGDGIGDNNINVAIEENAKLLRQIYDQMFSEYNVCQNILFGYSASGGSWFYDGYFYPTSGSIYPAFINLSCGSSGIDANWSLYQDDNDLVRMSENKDILNRTHLHYTVGTEDFLYPSVRTSVLYYQELGYAGTTEYLSNVAHCDFDIPYRTILFWEDRLSKLELIDVHSEELIPLSIETQVIQMVTQKTPYYFLAILTTFTLWLVRRHYIRK